MRTPRLTALLIATALAAAPSAVGFAEPAPAADVTTASTAEPKAPASDAERYAEREAKDTSVQDFEGGAEVLVIGGGTVAVVLLIVLLVILL